MMQLSRIVLQDDSIAQNEQLFIIIKTHFTDLTSGWPTESKNAIFGVHLRKMKRKLLDAILEKVCEAVNDNNCMKQRRRHAHSRMIGTINRALRTTLHHNA